MESVWNRMHPTPQREEALLALARVEAREGAIQERMAAIRRRLSFLAEQPGWLLDDQEERELQAELEQLGLELADVFLEHIRLDPWAGRR